VRRLSEVWIVLLPFAGFSCATGLVPSDIGSEDQADEDAGEAAAPVTDNDKVKTDGGGGSYSGGDASHPEHPDAGAMPEASAPEASVEAGAPETGGATQTDVCVGSESSQVRDIFGKVPYDDACDTWWSSGGPAKPCGPSGASCAAFNGSDGYGPYCCFVPPGQYCAQDYNNVPQCLPK
jgi:hypothetical protein